MTLVVGRVLSLEGGRARIAAYLSPKPPHTERERAVVTCAEAFVAQFEATKQAGTEYRALRDAIRDLRNP